MSVLGRLARTLLAGSAMMRTPRIEGVELHAVTLFYSYLRLRGIAAVPAAGAWDEAVLRAAFRVEVSVDGAAPQQMFRILQVHPGGTVEFAVEALTERAQLTATCELVFACGGLPTRFRLAELLLAAQTRDLRTLMPEFQAMVRSAQVPDGRPRLLDIGGRARSGISMAEHFPSCDVTVLDIVADTGVDVVGDAHELSRLFAPNSFDFVLSVSVFEHLLMPWKVAVEMSRVMRPGGIAMIHTHQTEAMHDLPWDFLRFSDAAWAGIFNRHTGFEVVRADLSRFMHVVPQVILEPVGDNENAGGFQCSSVIVRCTGAATVDWAVPLADVVAGAYPTGAYPTGAYPTGAYPTGAYPTGAYPTGPAPDG